MLIVDAHQDIAYNHICFGRDYRRPAWATRAEDARTGHTAGGVALLGLPDALIGRVAVVFATLFVAPADAPLASSWAEPTYHTPRQAHDLAMQQLDYYQRLADEDARVVLVHTTHDLDAVLATWAPGAPLAGRKQGLVVLMEGADPIIEPRQFEDWYARGVRVVGLAWSRTRYSGGTRAPGGLTGLGRELLEVLADVHALLDLSHMAEEAFYEALERYAGTAIIASHSNPRRFRDSDRHLSDAMIRRLAERDGVVGLLPYNTFLRDGWATGDTRLPRSVYIAAIDHVCQLVGSAAHAGIGSDWDGGFGRQSVPDGFDTVKDLLRIADDLRARGYSDDDVAAVLGGNMLRQLRRALPG